MSLSESIFLKQANVIKTILINIYGYRLYNLRYSDIKKYEHEYSIDFLKNKPRSELDEYQISKLNWILDIAKRNTDFYSERLNGISPVEDFSDFGKIPVLLKDEIRLNGEKLLSNNFSRRQRIAGHTSGSTGTPLDHYHSKESVRKMYSLYRSFRQWYGYKDGERRVRFGGRLIIPVTQKKPPFWLTDNSQKTLYLSLIHMSEDSLGYYVDAIKTFSAEEFSGYPSSIYILAEYCLSHGINSIQPKRIITDSETLLDYQRATIEKAFSCRVSDYYGISETQGIFAGQCPEGSYHLFPNAAYVEILDEDGKPVPDGETGHIHLTSLTNDCMPFIRYQVGDLATATEEFCSCGLQTRILKKLEGRTDDIVTLADGRKTGRLDHIFKQGAHIREAQIIQERPGEFTFHIVPGKDFSEKTIDEIKRSAEKRLGDDSLITFEITDKIARTGRGKFRSVIVKKRNARK